MKQAKSKVLCVLATLLGALFVLACVAGFAACGDGDAETYRFEAEDAKLEGDESEMLYWLDNVVYQGSYITGFGFIFDVQEDETASGGQSVGYLAHNNPTATFVINSKKAVSGATLTLGAASCDVDATGISSVFGLMLAGINSYAGADHDILTVNGESVKMSGTLAGSESVFSTDGLAMSNWGTLTATIDLVKGDNTIVLTHDGAGVNWDYIEIESTAALSMTKTDNSAFTVDKKTYTPSETPEDPTPSTPETTEFSRFVTGPYVENTSVKDYYYYKDSVSQNAAYFTGSEVTSVTYAAASPNSDDGLTGTYTINGTADLMSENQLKAFWGDGYEDHEGAEYLTITLLADEGETISITTSKDNTFALNGDSEDVDDTFFTRVQDVTTYTKGKQLYTFTVDEETYEVVLGDIVISSDTVKLEAEEAGLMNTIGKTNEYIFSSVLTSGVMGIETIDETDGITSVSNFKTGDQIVFAVYADEAISDVTITINAATASTKNDVTMTAETGIISVNGSTNLTVTGTLSANGKYNNWGTLTVDSAVSLVEGVNYIVLTCGSSAINVDGITLQKSGYDLVSVLSVQDVSTPLTYLADSVKAADDPESIVLEAETAAGLVNASGKKDSRTSGLLKEETLSTSTGTRESASIGNFNTSGDQIVFAVYADEAISGATITITGGTAITSGVSLANYVGSEHSVVVNDTSYTMEGTITASNGYIWNDSTYGDSFGTLTVSNVSLVEGVNYIVFTYDNAGGLNLDSITLTWSTTV